MCCADHLDGNVVVAEPLKASTETFKVSVGAEICCA